MTLLRALEAKLRSVFSELAKFGVVGLMSFLIDITLFNVLLEVTGKPLTSKVLSTVVAATNAFFLNRHWSFRHRERTNVRREYGVFFALNAVGLGISLLCLGISHYVLGFESVLADNISGSGVGLVLGTMFRFWSYRKFVWAAPEVVQEAADDGDAAAAAVLADESERRGVDVPGRP